MKIKKFEFHFTSGGIKYNAVCEKFKVPGFIEYPQYRVVVERGNNRSDIFNFYEVNNDTQKFFWFELPENKELVAKAIARSLARHTDRPELN